ncbi:MAG: hypothetical protein ACPGRX_00240, partial [Bdellovibrionales bacterium]
MTTMLFAPCAHAQTREYKGGMNHVFVKRAESPPKAIEPQAGQSQSAPAPDEQQQTEINRVWNKYKTLARGESEEQKQREAALQGAGKEKPDKPDTPDMPDTPEQSATQEQPAQARPTGFAAIIDEYRKSKEQRSAMKTIRIHQPEVAQPEKPSVQVPTTP